MAAINVVASVTCAWLTLTLQSMVLSPPLLFLLFYFFKEQNIFFERKLAKELTRWT